MRARASANSSMVNSPHLTVVQIGLAPGLLNPLAWYGVANYPAHTYSLGISYLPPSLKSLPLPA